MKKTINKTLKEQLLLYAVTDRTWLKDTETLAQKVEQAILGGVTMVQLREKDLNKESFLEEAKSIKTVCDRYQVPFLINDHVDIAKEVNASGVHLGQDDVTLPEARKILGEDKIIGISAHNVKEARKAQEEGADYLGVGAAFVTGTKADAKPIDFHLLQEICNTVSIPVVAIGGITLENMEGLRETNIDGIAVVSALFADKDITDKARRLQTKMKEMISIC